MNRPCLCFLLTLLSLLACSAQESGVLQNGEVVWRWNYSNGNFTSTLQAKKRDAKLELSGNCFQLTLGDGSVLNESNFKLVNPPHTESLPVESGSPTLSRHQPGRQLVLEFSNEKDHLSAIWTTSLRDGSSYLRQSLTLRASGKNVLLKDIVLLNQKIPGAHEEGKVEGSPVVAGDFFLGCEHPMARNNVSDDNDVRCGLSRNAVLKAGEDLTESFVLGVAEPGQMRRGFLTYIERERAHSYRTFLHYNSWFDIAWDKQKFNESQCLNVIDQFGRQLVEKRGVQMDSFLFDDGWDDDTTLWHFNSGFPNGFTKVKSEAALYHSGIGVWISPFGGYDEARRRRLEYGSKQGYETNASGFSMSGPKYYSLFRGICREMILKYGVNQFKFDGLAAGAKASQSGLTRDGDAMLRLVQDLRGTDPHIYINQTTGTWPSPFWLLYVDSTWRGGADHDFAGEGTWCQKWMTYRDAQTFHNIVKAAPLYPLNSLMLHGIIYATNALNLTNMSDEDFADQVREFFGNGTQLQEMYITPGLLNQNNWDALAEAARWSRRNADVLVDTHWIGGDPSKGEVYGWASWSLRLGILTLRNPTGQSTRFTAELKNLFELPAGTSVTFQLRSPWKTIAGSQPLNVPANQTHAFDLSPFEVLVLEAKPATAGSHALTTAPDASATGKASGLQ